jgi:protein gp37
MPKHSELPWANVIAGCGVLGTSIGVSITVRRNHRRLKVEIQERLVPGLDLRGIGWVIAGGESGRRARRCDPNWMRAVWDLCLEHSIPSFLKQWGTWESNPTSRDRELDLDAKGGATLDGRPWREFP